MRARTIASSTVATLAVCLLTAVWVDHAPTTQAQSANFETIQDALKEKKASIDQLNRKIGEYKEKISAKEKEVSSLTGELELLANRIAKSQLDSKATEEKIALATEEIGLLTAEQERLETELANKTSALASMLKTLQVEDQTMDLRLIFGSESFSELFDHIQYLESINSDLGASVKDVRSLHGQVELARTEAEKKKGLLVILKQELEQTQHQLEQEIGAKESLIAQTQSSEAQFHELLLSLKEEQSFTTHELGQLEIKLEQAIAKNDDGGDATVITWPVITQKGISAYFHDPTYPYRHLFEHSGIDLPLVMGTPVKAAAPGIVVRALQGNSYGNYVMIAHTNGMQTLYAHLSKIEVKPEQFVTRGQLIGKSGGAAGAPGAGLSTGPHLHFEVRKDGIPVNPLDYLKR
ncbi:peptidoglycan DD-metalloendopeptidase family protein [Candidatus Uhrbacteria bacterium]|nr:peptidoglycan DD-metalloendopeptidase family protein [Candidatus Uhrbacteria bacterium]